MDTVLFGNAHIKQSYHASFMIWVKLGTAGAIIPSILSGI